MHDVRRELGAALHFSVQVIKQFAGRDNYGVISKQLEIVTAVLNGDTKAVFNLFQMRIKGSAQVGELMAIVWFQSKLVRFAIGVQCSGIALWVIRIPAE